VVVVMVVATDARAGSRSRRCASTSRALWHGDTSRHPVHGATCAKIERRHAFGAAVRRGIDLRYSFMADWPAGLGSFCPSSSSQNLCLCSNSGQILIYPFEVKAIGCSILE
jgi:hypothetical protein